MNNITTHIRRVLFLVLLGFAMSTASAQVVITEIMYNPPEGGTDSLEYIELYNSGASAVNMGGWSFTQGFTYTFDTTDVIAAGDYFLLAVNSSGFMNAFGFMPDAQWSTGALSNSGEDIEIINGSGTVIDYVDFDDNTPWPTDADGGGYSLVLCDPSSDNNLATNWTISSNIIGFINNTVVYGSPGQAESGCVTAGDIFPPIVTDAEATSATSITVIFDEPVDPISSQNPLNYMMSNNSVVSAVQAPGFPEIVILTLGSSLSAGVFDTLTVSGVADTAGNVMSMAQSFTVGFGFSQPSIVITEIMYNDPGSSTDALEFIEFYNYGLDTVALNNFYMDGVTYTFGDTSMTPGQYFVLAVNPDSFETVFGFTPMGWTSGALSNGGESIVLYDALGNVVDSVAYDDNSLWPDADGSGYSLVRCGTYLQSSSASSWGLSASYQGVYAGADLYASPELVECINGCGGKDNFEPNDDFQTSTELPKVGINKNARICDPADVDWYAYEVGDDNNFLVLLTGLAADLDMDIYDNNLNLLFTSTNTGTDFELFFTNNATVGNTYYFAIYPRDYSYASAGYKFGISSRSVPISREEAEQAATRGEVIEENVVALDARPVGGFQVYPNPATTSATLHFYVEEAGKSQVIIRDVYGKQVLLQHASVQAGYNEMELDTDALAAGTYLVEWRSGEARQTTKLIISQ